MKQKDIAVILVVAGVAAIIAFAGSKFLFGSAQAHDQEVEKVDAISTSFPLPSAKYFNADSINPTQQVQVTDNNNTNPFGN